MGRLRYGIHNMGVVGLGSMGTGALGGYREKVLGLNPIAYWMLSETTGTTAICQVNTAQNGTYARDVSVMGTGTGIGDGRTAPDFDGTNDVIDIYSATFAGVFLGTVGTVAGWLRMSGLAIWTDGLAHRVMQIRGNATNYISILKGAANNRLQTLYSVNGGLVVRNADGYTSTGWLHLCATYADSANGAELKIFVNGAQVGAAAAVANAWNAVGLSNTTTVIGGSAVPPIVDQFDGFLAHCAVWTRRLSDPEIASLAAV